MTNATLEAFRTIADEMGCNKGARFAVLAFYSATCRKEMPVVFGLTRERAESAAKFYKHFSRIVTDAEALEICRTR